MQLQKDPLDQIKRSSSPKLNTDLGNVMRLLNDYDSGNKTLQKVSGATVDAVTTLSINGIAVVPLLQQANLTLTGQKSVVTNTGGWGAMTGTSISFTPKTTTSRVFLFLTGTGSVSASGDVYYSLGNGTASLSSDSSGIFELSVAGNMMVAMVATQVPAATTAQTYQVICKAGAGTPTAFLNTGTTFFILEFAF